MWSLLHNNDTNIYSGVEVIVCDYCGVVHYAILVYFGVSTSIFYCKQQDHHTVIYRQRKYLPKEPKRTTSTKAETTTVTATLQYQKKQQQIKQKQDQQELEERQIIQQQKQNIILRSKYPKKSVIHTSKQPKI